MNNTNYKPIYNTRKGGIYREVTRGLYQVEHGNIMLLFSYENLLSFSHFIGSADKEKIQKLKSGPSNKIVIYPGEFVGCYAFTEEEFWDLKELLEGGVSILKMEKQLVEILNDN